MEPQMDFVVRHFFPGRLRVTFPCLVSNKELSDCMKMYLSGRGGITSVTSNHLCGSITVTYDPQYIDRDALLAIFSTITMTTLAQVRAQMDKAASDQQTSRAVLQAHPMDLRAPQLPEGGNNHHWSDALLNPWNLAGHILVGVGVVGIVVPLIPSVPSLLAAAFCYTKGSPRFHAWLTHHPTLGPYIRGYLDGQGVPWQVKRHSITLVWVSLGISVVFLVQSAVLRFLMVLVGTAVTVYILRMKTAECPERPSVT